jgi:TolB-like protein
MSLITELKRRNVFKVAAAYTIVGWLLVQVASVLLPTFESPEWVMKVLVLIVMLGFPIAVIMAWALELTPEGIKREKDIHTDDSIAHKTGRKLDFAIIGLLAIALAYVVIDNYVLDTGPEQAAVVGTMPDPGDPAEPQQRDNSIAVLPFVNMSSDPEQEFFSDGLSEELLNLLAKVPDLKVIGRTSSFAFKGKNEDLRGIGEALGVSTVLEGSVRKSGERVRITAQLIEVQNGTHLWSETYDRTLTDIFAVQDDVAAAILEAMEIHVGAAPKRGRPTENLDAYSLFLKARAAMSVWDAIKSEEFLLQAVELDPDFAEAYELLAYTYWEQWGTFAAASRVQPLAFEAATRALAINPDLMLARMLQATSDGRNHRVVGEVESLKQILETDPNHAVALEMLVWILQYTGYFQESLELAERAVALDPLSANAQGNLATSLNIVGRSDEALATLELADQLGALWAKSWIASLHRMAQRDELANDFEEAWLKERGLPHAWLRDLIAGARNPASGQAYLDRRIPEIIATVPPERAFEMTRYLGGFYLIFGFLDRYYELIFDNEISSTNWGDAEVLISVAVSDRNSGFTAHPKFLELAELLGFFELWERHGPPDFCEKVSEQWVCQ